MDFLNTQEIKQLAPSIYTSTPSSEVSKFYTHIPTSKVIDDMQTLGWGVVKVTQVKARKNQGFQKHLVVFRNPDISIEGQDGDVVFPQILLTNSHDGKNSFTFTAGLFRLICSNGLVISTEKFGKVQIRHMGYTFEKLQTQIYEMVSHLPLTVESMNKMKQIQLDQQAILDFANQAIQYRFPNQIKIDLPTFIIPVRSEDKGTDLWKVYNVIQEKLMGGGFNYISNKGKTRKARKINNFQQDLEINKKLFELAYSYVS
jgi:hypothetical protein